MEQQFFRLGPHRARGNISHQINSSNCFVHSSTTINPTSFQRTQFFPILGNLVASVVASSLWLIASFNFARSRMARKSVTSGSIRVGSLVATPETATTSRARGVSVGRGRAETLLATAAADHGDSQEEGYDEEEAMFISTCTLLKTQR
jgi:hypothetical protein